MAVSGLARVLSVVLLTLRAKVVAMLLGPEGIGLLGLFTALQEMGAQTADGGLAHSTVRNIARARERRRRLARLLQAMRSAVLVLGLAAALLIWCAREPIAQMILGSEDNALAVGILGVGVALTMVYRAQQAVLSGFRQVRDLAILTASATALATAGGVGAIAILGLDGIIWAVLAGPIAGVAVASIFVARLGLPRAPRPAFSVLIAHQRAIFGVGLGLMLSALAALVTPLVLRIWLIHSQGLDAAGLFQAALAISMQVSGLILAAAATEYYPRLSATISDKNAVRHQANDQAMLYLSAGGPLIVALAALAPWVLELLYTSAFRDAVEVLRWLLLGMVARLLVVPAEMILMASASARRILAAQLLHQISVLAAAFWALDPFGGVGFAVAIAAGQVVHLILVSLMAARAAGFAWRRRVLGFAAAFAVLAACSQALPGLAGDWATIGTCCLVAGGAGLAAAGLARLGFVPRPTMLVQRRIRFARSQR